MVLLLQGGGCMRFFAQLPLGFGSMAVLSDIVFDLDDEDCKYEQVDCEHRLSCDRVGDATWQLTDSITGASCSLAGEHALAFGYGLALLQNKATDAELEPALLLQEDLVRNKASGEVFLCSVAQVGDALQYRIKEDWDNKASAHEPGTATLSLVSVGCRCDLQVAVFVAPRHGNLRIFWSLPDLYKVLRFDFYSGQSSKWVYQRRADWEKQFQDCLHHCVVFTL